MQSMIAFRSLLPHRFTQDAFQVVLCDYDPALDGIYDFVDLYCPDRFCNCHKVTMLALNAEQQVVATVAYGWKPKLFYRRWGLDPVAAESLTHGFLDPWGVQSEQSPVFLQAFLDMLNENSVFINRIKRRYEVFKEAIAAGVKLPSTEKLPLPDNVIPIKRSYR